MSIPQTPRKLHIGGTIRTPGWEILDANPGPHVDHVCNANDLSRFAENTFGELYASHVVEHFDYIEELPDTLKEWNRVLLPGGKIFLSVPDLEILATLFLDKNKLNLEERFFVMRMIYGGHVDEYDYHYAGLNEEFFTTFLAGAGYINIRRVTQFGLFHDTSTMLFKGVAISLNMIAEKRDGPALNPDGTMVKTGRNENCPCGSGLKYKHCHGKAP